MKLHNPSLSFFSLSISLSFSQDGNFTRAEIMPTEPPPVKIVGQSSFVDFGENDRYLSFAVISDKLSGFVCDCGGLTDRSILNTALACTVEIWIVIQRTQNVKKKIRKHTKSVCKRIKILENL